MAYGKIKKVWQNGKVFSLLKQTLHQLKLLKLRQQQFTKKVNKLQL
jgi:hypothetical protein